MALIARSSHVAALALSLILGLHAQALAASEKAPAKTSEKGGEAEPPTGAIASGEGGLRPPEPIAGGSEPSQGSEHNEDQDACIDENIKADLFAKRQMRGTRERLFQQTNRHELMVQGGYYISDLFEGTVETEQGEPSASARIPAAA